MSSKKHPSLHAPYLLGASEHVLHVITLLQLRHGRLRSRLDACKADYASAAEHHTAVRARWDQACNAATARYAERREAWQRMKNERDSADVDGRCACVPLISSDTAFAATEAERRLTEAVAHEHACGAAIDAACDALASAAEAVEHMQRKYDEMTDEISAQLLKLDAVFRAEVEVATGLERKAPKTKEPAVEGMLASLALGALAGFLASRGGKKPTA